MDYVESAALKSKSQSQPPPAGGASPKTGKAHRSVENGNSSSSSSGDSSESSDSDSSLEDYEENQQPQTVEIMNSQLLAKATAEAHQAPKIVKTTTKQIMVQNAGGVQHKKEQKTEDLTPGGTGAVTVVSSTNKAELDDSMPSSNVPHVKATQVTTRTALTKEDKETNSKTSQVEEKTFTATTMTTGLRQEQRVVTQEVRTATILTNAEPALDETPIVKTESVKYDPSAFASVPPTTSSSYPCVPTESRTVGGVQATNGGMVMGPPIVTTLMNEGEVITTHSITSKTRTVETVTYQKEHDGLVETRVEQKITVQSDGDPIDHDKALAEAIQEATAMNPDMTVEKIEIQQQAVQP